MTAGELTPGPTRNPSLSWPGGGKFSILVQPCMRIRTVNEAQATYRSYSPTIQETYGLVEHIRSDSPTAVGKRGRCKVQMACSSSVLMHVAARGPTNQSTTVLKISMTAISEGGRRSCVYNDSRAMYFCSCTLQYRTKWMQQDSHAVKDENSIVHDYNIKRHP